MCYSILSDKENICSPNRIRETMALFMPSRWHCQMVKSHVSKARSACTLHRANTEPTQRRGNHLFSWESQENQESMPEAPLWASSSLRHSAVHSDNTEKSPTITEPQACPCTEVAPCWCSSQGQPWHFRNQLIRHRAKVVHRSSRLHKALKQNFKRTQLHIERKLSHRIS